MVESSAENRGPRPGQRYSLGDLVLDADRRRVTRSGRVVRLPGLSFDLLWALARQAPEVVSVSDLIEEVWAGRVINDETVAQRVRLLREALGDDSRNPRYVAVERGRGYRLVVPVARLPDAGTSRRSWPGLRPALWLLLPLLLGLAWVGWPDPPPVKATATIVPASANAIAVLPFARTGDDEQIELLAFGLAEAVLHRLASLPDLTVIAGSSSLALDPDSEDARSLGRRLGAGYLVRGSVLMADGRLRITAQLIDTTDGTQVWSEQFERTQESFFSIQTDIAQHVAERLRQSFAPDPISARETSSFDAFLAFQRARRLLLQRGTAAVEQAIDELHQAIALDPDYARAHAALAEAWATLAGLEGSYETPHPQYRETLQRALALDPGLGDAWILLALVEPDPEAADRMIERGLELNPSSNIGHDRRINRLHQDQRHLEALAAVDRAMRVDPLAPRFPYMKALIVMHMTLRFDEAERWLLRALEIDPAFPPALIRLAQMHSWNGDFAEAVLLGEQALALGPDTSWVRYALTEFHFDLDDAESARRLTELEAPWMGDVLVPLYQGEYARAAAVARSDPGPASLSQRYRPYARALLAHARAGGSAADSIDVLLAMPGIELRPDPRPLQWGDLGTGFALVELLRMNERRSDAEALLGIIETWLERRAETVDPDHPWLHRHRAVVHALRGRDEHALAALQRAFDGGARAEAWYTLNHDPAFRQLRARPEFVALQRDHREWVERQQARLEAERRRRGGALAP